MKMCEVCDNKPSYSKNKCKKCYMKLYRQENKPWLDKKNQKRMKEYYKQNKEKILKRTQEYSESKPFQTKYFRIKKNANKRGIVFDMDKNDFISLIKKHTNCVYCGVKLEHTKQKTNYNQLSIDRKNNNEGYLLNNIAVCCYLCNKVKGDILTYDDMKIVGKMIKKRRKENV